MDNCKYQLNIDGNILKFDSEKELAKYIKDFKLDTENSIKFSIDLSNRQNLVSNAIKGKYSKLSENALSIVDFLKKPHDVGKGAELLAPFLDENSYVEIESKKRFNEKPKEDETTLEQFQEELREDLKEDDIMRVNGISIHKIALMAVKNTLSTKENQTNIDASILEFVNATLAYKNKQGLKNDPNFEEVEYTDEQIDNYRKKVKIQVKEFINEIYSQGVPIIKPNLMDSNNKIKGQPDIVVIDTFGVPHIVDIAISRKVYGDWNKAKALNQDYKLGIFRQLIENIAPTNKTELFVAPFVMEDMDLDNFRYTKMQERAKTNPSLAHSSESINSISGKLKVLFPSSFTSLHTLSKDIDGNSEKLISAMFPNYISRSKYEKSKEQHIKEIKKNKTKDSDYSFYDTIKRKSVKIEKEEDIEKVVDEYLQKYEEIKHEDVYSLYKAVQRTLQTGGKTIEFEKDKAKNRINIVLNQYLNGDWELLGNPIFMNQGMLIFRNKRLNTIDAISVTSNNLTTPYDFGLGTTLLGKFLNNDKAKEDPEIKSAIASNIEAIRLLSILNNMPELLANNKIGGLKVLNYAMNQSEYSDNTEKIIHNFNRLFKEVNNKEDIGIENIFEKESHLTDKFSYWYNEILNIITKLDDAKMEGFGGVKPDVVEEKLKWLKSIQKRLIESYPSLIDQEESKDFKNNKAQYLQYLVGNGIRFYNGMRADFDYGSPQLGVSPSDLGHILQTVRFGESRDYDKEGNRLVGLFGGTMFKTSDDMASEYKSEVYDLGVAGHSEIRALYAKVLQKISKKTNEYYVKAGRSGMEKMLLGKSEPYHEVFFKRHPDTGKISDDFEYKNPYDMNEVLKDYERDYLKFILWETYKFKKNLGMEFYNIDYKSIEKNERFDEFTKDPIYIKAPLAKKTDLSKWSSTDNFREAIGKRVEEFQDSLDPRAITEMQRNKLEDQVNSAYTMYNEFNIDDDFRKQLISKYDVKYFETNLDTMALKLSFSHIRENVFNNILPNINAAIINMQYHGWQSGKSEETKKATEEMFKQIRISIYGVNPIKGELAKSLKYLQPIQKLASMLYITMRPALSVKELIVGSFKNVSFAWSKIYGDDTFSMSDLKSAYNKVLFGKMQSPVDFNIVDNLNIEYGIANMDINTIVHKTKTDRHGAFKFFSENMYWFNNSPDYLNRLTLLVAKMIHDGSYDAHSIDSDGKFIYDPTKDKRFEVYFKNRKKYDFKSADKDSVYNDQRSMYLTFLEDFNIENRQLGKPLLNEKTDLIPRAYTNKERESIKTFSDTAYGYYDHERSAPWKHTALGMIFGQFLTFWPSKVKYYFAKPEKSKYGKYEQKYTIEPNGEKKYLFIKDILNEAGDIIGTEETYENTGRKANHFMGSMFEGLMYSLGLTMRDLVTGNINDTPVERVRRAKLAIHDILLGMLLIALVRIMFEQFKEEGGNKESRKKANQAIDMTEKALTKALNEFNPFDSVFNAFSWEPAFVGLLSNVKKDFGDLFSGNSDVSTFFRSNFKAMEVIPYGEE